MPHNFTTEYGLAETAVKTGTFDDSWKTLIGELRILLGTDGPDDAAASSLDKLRKEIRHGGSYAKSLFKGTHGEDGEILVGVGGYTPDKSGLKPNATAAVVKKAAAIKLLRHLYLLRRRGGQKIWLVSTPGSYRNWPSEELNGLDANFDELRTKLKEGDGYFDSSERKDIADGTQEALKWCMKAQIVLANAKSGKGHGKDLITRWFAASGATDGDIDTMLTTLSDGFKKITSVVNSHKLIFTDYPPDRGTADETGTEAFVFNSGWRDRLHVVYVEQGFFGKGTNVLSGLMNWARIIVHEVSHREIPTVDVPQGYGWQGINPTDGKFAGGLAITNAENWAYFAADCANALSKGQRSKLLD